MIETQTETEEILRRAAQRGAATALPYGGAVTPHEANWLHIHTATKIVDVRSDAEYRLIGRIPGSIFVAWKHSLSGEKNADFLAELKSACNLDATVLFLCRSGVRSDAAARVAVTAGYQRAFNILEGFEGDLDQNGQRGNLGGWRKAGLPWVQD